MQLKEQGNRLHSAGSYQEATEKYERAKTNLAELQTPEAKALRKACVLNLGSCYLNLKMWQKCVQECDTITTGEGLQETATEHQNVPA